MGRLSNFVIFISVGLSILLGLHYYLWLRLVRDTQLPGPWRAITTIGLAIAAASIPTTLVFLRRSSAGPLRPLLWAAFIWMGLMFLLFVLLLGADTIWLGFWAFRRATGTALLDPQRRRFLARLVAGGAVAAATGVGAWGIRSAVGPISVRRVEVPLRRLGRGHDGVTFAQLTDLHIGPTIGKEHLAAIVQTTNALAPDIVAITGDLVDGSVEDLRDAVSPLADRKSVV